MMYTKKEVLLTAKDVGLSFKQKSGPNKVIFKDVNFQVHDVVRPGQVTGQVISLVGKSGIGKTQMIRLLSGLYIHDAVNTGSILINAAQTPVNTGDIGVVPQNYYLPVHMTLAKILFAAAKHRKNKGISEAEIVNYYLKQFDLWEHRDKYPVQLSGGQKQRAAISCQLLYGANFLLLDEPFSGLDPIMLDKTLDLLIKVAQTDELKTIIIVSHDLRNCIAISDTVFILSNKDRNSEEGATIVQQIDLMEMGLAWQPDIKEMPTFLNLIKEVKTLL